MLDMRRIITIGFCAVNGITERDLRTAPSTKSWNELRKELAWALRAMSSASRKEIAYIIGRSDLPR